MFKAVLRLPEVKARVGLSRSSIYFAIAQSEFPKAISLGSRAVGWIEEEIDNWIAKRVRTSRPE